MTYIYRLFLAALAATSLSATAPTDAREALIWRIHAQLVRLEPAYAERNIEAPATRSMRLLEVARVLSRYGVDMRRKLTAKATHETHWAAYTRRVCTDVPKGAGHCDHGKSMTYWQLRYGACDGLRDATEHTVVAVAAQCAADRLRWAWSRCKTNAERFAAYGNGKCVPTANSKLKAAQYAQMGGE